MDHRRAVLIVFFVQVLVFIFGIVGLATPWIAHETTFSFGEHFRPFGPSATDTGQPGSIAWGETLGLFRTCRGVRMASETTSGIPCSMYTCVGVLGPCTLARQPVVTLRSPRCSCDRSTFAFFVQRCPEPRISHFLCDAHVLCTREDVPDVHRGHARPRDRRLQRRRLQDDDVEGVAPTRRVRRAARARVARGRRRPGGLGRSAPERRPVRRRALLPGPSESDPSSSIFHDMCAAIAHVASHRRRTTPWAPRTKAASRDRATPRRPARC